MFRCHHLNMIVFSRCFLVAVIVSCLGPATSAADNEAANVPVRRVVMFSSGVAFFEHGGEVDGNTQVDLKFNVRDINDLLKSMVLQDLGGGQISTISYGSKDPITRTLETFSIDLTQNPTLADLLGQIRGEKVEIDAPSKVNGTIISLEKRKRYVGENDVVEVDYLTLLTDEGLNSLSLENAGRIKLANPKLDAELRQALLVLATSHSTDKKTVSINFLGNGQRQVRIGYIQESPIWKTSYRLVLDDESQPLLQGWAIVENTTESDWDDINLSLVSGRPISFVMDLYQPLYIDRPVVLPELYASLRPRTYDQDLAAAEADSRKPAALAASQPKRRLAPRAFSALTHSGTLDLETEETWDITQGISAVVQTDNAGETFRYEIDTPVKLQRGRSAMLPIVNEPVEGERFSIYNETTHARHPLSGMKLTNSTSLHLVQGPITVFDGATYAGDALIQDLPPDSELLISYAMDLDIEVAPSGEQQPKQLVSCRLVKGTIHTTHKKVRTKKYIVKNSGSQAKQVFIEYPLDSSWTLVEPKVPTEKTRDLYRFVVKAEPGKPAELKVTEENTVRETTGITNLPDNQAHIYLNSKVVSDEVKQALAEVIKRKTAIEAVTSHRQEHERKITVINQEQDRIRQNMAELPKDTDLFRRYITKFSEQEDQIEDLRKKVIASRAEEAKLKKELDDYLVGLDLI